MQIRTILVGVDAHIDPHGRHSRFHETLRQTCDCPTGGQGRPPLQDIVRGRRWRVQYCVCVPPGRARHRPLQRFCVVAVRCAVLVVHPAREGQSPSPTQIWRMFAPQPTKNPPAVGCRGILHGFSYLANTFFRRAKRGRPSSFSSFVSPWMRGRAYLAKSWVTLLPSALIHSRGNFFS